MELIVFVQSNVQFNHLIPSDALFLFCRFDKMYCLSFGFVQSKDGHFNHLTFSHVVFSFCCLQVGGEGTLDLHKKIKNKSCLNRRNLICGFVTKIGDSVSHQCVVPPPPLIQQVITPRTLGYTHN